MARRERRSYCKVDSGSHDKCRHEEYDSEEPSGSIAVQDTPAIPRHVAAVAGFGKMDDIKDVLRSLLLSSHHSQYGEASGFFMFEPTASFALGVQAEPTTTSVGEGIFSLARSLGVEDYPRRGRGSEL